MSYLGSPFSNSYNHEYQYDEEKFEDEDKDPEEQDGSNEDTEDASETDAGRKGHTGVNADEKTKLFLGTK